MYLVKIGGKWQRTSWENMTMIYTYCGGKIKVASYHGGSKIFIWMPFYFYQDGISFGVKEVRAPKRLRVRGYDR